MTAPSERDKGIFVSARTFEEYRAMFALTERDLSGSTLDCAAGGASFTAEACAAGYRVRAVDPIYAETEQSVSNQVWQGVARANANVMADPGDYHWVSIADYESHRGVRKHAARTFLADRRANPERYVAGVLPELPVEDVAVDLTVCSYFLFTYCQQLSTEFHLAAIRELVRVSAREVRIFPVVGFRADAAEILEAVIADLERASIAAELVDVPYRFQIGAHEMLRVDASAAHLQFGGASALTPHRPSQGA